MALRRLLTPVLDAVAVDRAFARGVTVEIMFQKFAPILGEHNVY